MPSLVRWWSCVGFVAIAADFCIIVHPQVILNQLPTCARTHSKSNMPVLVYDVADAFTSEAYLCAFGAAEFRRCLYWNHLDAKKSAMMPTL